MKIYSRRGDQGRTDLLGAAERWLKSADRVAAFGEVDELNASIGVALSKTTGLEDRHHLVERLESVQHDLFAVGAHLATPPADLRRSQPKIPPLPVNRVTEMESWIDDADRCLPPLRAFVMPGGTELAAALHMARTVCRRAERAVVRIGGRSLDQLTPGDEGVIRYLNRLSDLLFTLARLANHLYGVRDVEWRPSR